MHSEDLEIFYNLIGKAVWHLQYVEDALCMFIMLVGHIKTPGAFNEEEISIFVKKNRSFTFGRLLSIAKDKEILEDCLSVRLQNLKEERNWLIHKVNHEAQANLYVYEEREKIFTRINHVFEEAVDLQNLICIKLTSYSESKGVNTKEILETTRKKYNDLIEKQT